MSVHLSLCVCSFSPGVSIWWEATEYRVSEDIATLQLVLLKKNFLSYNLTVTVTTQDSSAKGIIIKYMHNYKILIVLCN